MRSVIIFFLFPLFLAGCANTLYMGKLAWGEARILAKAVPTEKILKDQGIDKKIKDGIRLVQEVKAFAQRRLGLRLDGSYDTFYPVTGDTLVYLVSACPKDSMEPYTWRFPIVGRVEYKGFFSKKDAVREIKKLEMKGLDTCLQEAIAFSTLGWLDDPLYSTILKYQPVAIINIIIHELVHNTIYFKGETEFNEQIASLIAEKGSLMFIEEHFGLSSAEYQKELDIASDDKLIAGFFQDLYNVLKGLYARDLPMAENLRLREEIFAFGQQRLAELSTQLKTGEALGPSEKLNNAVILAYRRYITPSQGVLQQVYEAVGSNVKAFIELLLAARKSGESPAIFLTRWLETRPQSPAG